METIRREALIEATIKELGIRGSLDVTVSQIASRAGVSSGLAHHYFGSKDEIFMATMRHILVVFGDEARRGLGQTQKAPERLQAIVTACFSASNFKQDVIAAWLNFYVLAQRSSQARRLLSIYHRRLRSNLIHELRKLKVSDAEAAADRIGGLIDGLYLRCAIAQEKLSGEQAIAHVLEALDKEIAGRP